MDAFKEVSAAARNPIILLFTKIDVFEELLSTYSFTDYLPNCSGPLNSSNFRMYLASRFQGLHRLHRRSSKSLFIRVVNAADPKAFKKVFEEIESKISKPWPRPTENALSDKFSSLKPPRPLIIDDDHVEDSSLDAYIDYDDDPALSFDFGSILRDQEVRDAHLSFHRELPLRG